MRDGSRLELMDEEVRIAEDKQCAEILSKFNLQYPSVGSSLLVAFTSISTMPKIAVRQALNFFTQSTFPYAGKAAYDEYLVNLRELFELLFGLDSELFTAFYKLEIPFDAKYRPIVDIVQSCLRLDDSGGAWTEGLNINFEWLSVGEYHIATLFSAIFQSLQMFGVEATNSRDVILVIDEPEMHMHPEFGRTFIGDLDKAIRQFKESGAINSCQIILATHSPFIIQSLSNYNRSFTLVEKENNQIKTKAFLDIPHLRLPNRSDFSFNLIMYKIFNIPTNELHDELYGELFVKSEKKEEKDFDQWLVERQIPLSMRWTREKKNGTLSTYDVTLQTFIRNKIHHSENKYNTYDIHEDKLKQSLDEMISLLFAYEPTIED